MQVFYICFKSFTESVEHVVIYVEMLEVATTVARFYFNHGIFDYFYFYTRKPLTADLSPLLLKP
jgi:hypothetical protein